MYIAVFFIVLIIVGIIVYFVIKSGLSKQINLKLELDPPEVTKGEKVKVIVRANPTQKVTLQSLEGNLIGKKYDGYSGSYLEKTEYPVISPGVLLSKTEFSFGNNIELIPGEENKRFGVIPIPDDATATEVRGVMQVHWFITIKAKISPVMPAVTVQDELIILRPEIYSGEETTAAGEALSEFSFYDPSVDLNRPENEAKILESNVIEPAKKKDTAAGKKAGAKSSSPQGVSEFRRKTSEEPYKVDYKTPFDPGKQTKAKSSKPYDPGKKMQEIAKKSRVQTPSTKKMKYHEPFDPAKKIMEDAEKFARQLEKEQKPKKKGPSYHRPDNVPEKYRTRHKIGGFTPRMDTSKIPSQYRQRHSFYSGSSKPTSPSLRKEVKYSPNLPGSSSQPKVVKKKKKRDKFSNLDKYS